MASTPPPGVNLTVMTKRTRFYTLLKLWLLEAGGVFELAERKNARRAWPSRILIYA
jgi:hypothetical protein